MGFLHHFVGGRTFLASLGIDPRRKFAIAVPRALTQYHIDFAHIFMRHVIDRLGMICRSGKVCRDFLMPSLLEGLVGPKKKKPA
jgi:hypothetical protein